MVYESLLLIKMTTAGISGICQILVCPLADVEYVLITNMCVRVSLNSFESILYFNID